MSRTVSLTKDGVEYELEVSLEGRDTFIIESVTALTSLGVIKAEQDIDPEEFQEKLTQNDWSKIEDWWRDD